MEKKTTNFRIGLYHVAGVVGGVGAGIVFSNAYLLNHLYGLGLLVFSFIVTVYLWNSDIKKHFE